MNNKSAIIYILLLLVCNVLHNPAKANSGLFFQSHRVIPEKRTELNLTPDAPFSFQDGFSLNFDVHLRNEEHNYGYIVRVVLNDTLNIDLLSNKGWSHSQLFLMKGTQNLMDIPRLDSIPGFSNSDWFQVKLVINYKKQFITCVLNGKEWSIPAELPLLNNVRITFGLHTGQPYPSTDVAPMNLRNIRILDRQGQLLRKWSLLQHGDNEVYDEVKFSRATVRNGIWEIDHHIRWRKKASFIIPGTSLQFAPYQRPADGGVFITLKDTIYQYSIEKEKLDTIIVNSGHPYFTAASSLVYDSVYDELILVANKNNLASKKISAFLTALEQATTYLQNNPNDAWQAFVSYKSKELNTELNQLAWKDTLPLLATKPRQLDAKRYQQMAEFMHQKGLIPKALELKDYTVELQ